MRIKQLNKIKGNYEEKEDYEKQRNEQINTMINNYKHFKMDNRRINVYPKTKIKNNLKAKEKSKENNNYLKENKTEENDRKYIFENTQNKNGINIKEINNRLRRKKET